MDVQAYGDEEGGKGRESTVSRWYPKIRLRVLASKDEGSTVDVQAYDDEDGGTRWRVNG